MSDTRSQIGEQRDVRDALRRVLDSIEDEPLRMLVAETFQSSSVRKVWHTLTCRSCGQQQRDEVEVEVPSAKLGERVKALSVLLAEGKGRVAEQRNVTVDVTVRSLEEMRGLSDAQLAAIASGAAVVEDAEWGPLELTAGDGAG